MAICLIRRGCTARSCRHADCLNRRQGVPLYRHAWTVEHVATAQARRQQASRDRTGVAERHLHHLYKTKGWQSLRLSVLAAEPLCRVCRAGGRVTPATVVDHVVPHRGNRDLFWDRSNTQPLCATCHGIKTARERAESSRD